MWGPRGPRGTPLDPARGPTGMRLGTEQGWAPMAVACFVWSRRERTGLGQVRQEAKE